MTPDELCRQLAPKGGNVPGEDGGAGFQPTLIADTDLFRADLSPCAEGPGSG